MDGGNMTNLPELISRLRSAVHEESVLISPRTSKLIEEVKSVIGVLEGEAGLPTREMVERVARALCQRKNGWRNDPGFIDRQWHLDIEDARAAIEAMREPTEAMVEVGRRHEPQIGIEGIYRDMIDAALAPGRAPNQDPPHE